MHTQAEPRLVVEDVASGYASMAVVREVSFGVKGGEAVVLLGANGAGKSTILRAIAGMLPAYQGSVRLMGQDVTRRSVEHRARRGFGMVPEGRALFAGLTVEDNLEVGAWAARSRGDAMPLDEIYERHPTLAEKRHIPAGLLSGGQQQLVAIVRALRPRPAVLVLDEPSLGLSPRATKEVMPFVAEQVRNGAAPLMAEQNIATALSVADRAHAVKHGRATELEDITDLGDQDKTRDLLL